MVWRLEVQDLGVGKVGSSEVSPWLVDDLLLPCPYMVFPLCVSVS